MDHSGTHTFHERQPQLVSLKPLFHLDSAVAQSAAASHIKPVLLDEIQDVSIQQALIVKDLLFALRGYEGYYVRYSERYDVAMLRNRIRGPDFKVAAPLDISLKTVTKKVLRYGKMYLGLSNFSQIYNMLHFGRVNQRLCGEIRTLLVRFRHLVLSFEESFHTSPFFSLSAIDNEIQNTCADNLKHLYEIACEIHAESEQKNPRFQSAMSVSMAISGDITGRNPKFDTFLNSIKTDISLGTTVSSDLNAFDACKGGLVLRIVENRISQYEGDMKACDFLSGLFEAISADYVTMLNTWLAEGEVDDVFHEFLVKKNDLPKNIFYSNVERYWEELYVIKIDGLLDRFADKDVQLQVLATGKFLNIFKRCIGSASLRDFPDNISTVARPSDVTSLRAQDVQYKILQFYDRANNLLLKLLFKGYCFHEMVTCLHQTYVLCESSKTDRFFHKMLHELSKSKKSASTVTLIDTFNAVFRLGECQLRHQISRYMQVPISAKIPTLMRTLQRFSIDANDFYALSEEIIGIRSFDASHAVPGDEQASSAIRKLVSQSLKQPPISSLNDPPRNDPDSDIVIAAVNIDCELPFPINLMVSENYVFEFQLIFKLQMILKYTSKVVDSAWRDSMYSTVWNYKHFSGPLKKLILRSRVLIYRMKNFTTELQNYVDHLVIEANYAHLNASLGEISLSLDKPRSPSKTARSNSSYKDTAQPLTKHGNQNSIFDAKIKKSSSRQVAGVQFGPSTTPADIYALSNSLGTYLSNILRDSMITNSMLLNHLRTSLAVVTKFTNISSRLKKTFILTDADLLQAFAQDYPGRFDTVKISEELVKTRILGLNNVITKFWTEFNLCLREFTEDLSGASTENASFAFLCEKLAML